MLMVQCIGPVILSTETQINGERTLVNPNEKRSNDSTKKNNTTKTNNTTKKNNTTKTNDSTKKNDTTQTKDTTKKNDTKRLYLVEHYI